MRGALPDVSKSVASYDYSTNSTDSISLGEGITTLTSGITERINLKLPTTTLTSLGSYTSTTNYTRGSNGATLLPLDVVNLHSGCIDIGLYCVEIYKKRSTTLDDLVRVDACEIKAAGKTLGGDYYTPESGTNNDEFDETVEMMSIAKDTCGNCYVIKKDVILDDIDDYLNVKDEKFVKIDPTNQSKWYGYNSQNNSNWKMELSPTFESRLRSEESSPSTRIIPVQPTTGEGELCAFECYVRGFLFMNQNSKTTGGDIDNDAPHANFIWIDAPILFSITKSTDNKYQIKIGDLIETDSVAYDPVSSDKVLFTAELKNPISSDIVGNNVKLPINSGFFTSNFIKTKPGTETKKFTGVEITISSLDNYW